MARPRTSIDAAALADAFAADGLHGTSSVQLAAALGVAKPTLYAHGTSKDALFLRAVEAEVERLLTRVQAAEAATAGRSARERAAATALAVLDHAAARPGGARLLHRTARHGSSSVADAVTTSLRRVPDRLEAMLRRDLAADGLRADDAPFLARAVLGAAVALSEVHPGERRPARANLAALAAAPVPAPPALPATAWPTA